MANKQPQVTEQTRANLTSAFWELYLTKPIEKITIREITDRAGYNRATFYLYFHDVYDLFDQLEEDILTQVRGLVQNRLMQADELDFSQHMGLIIQLAQRFDGYMPRLIAGDPTFSDRMKAIMAPLLDRFIIPSGVLDPHEQSILREFYLSGILGAINTWMTARGEVPLERLIELIVGTVFRMPPCAAGEGPRAAAGDARARGDAPAAS